MKIRGIQSEKFKSSRYKYEDIYYQIMVMHKKDLWRGGGGGEGMSTGKGMSQFCPGPPFSSVWPQMLH